MQYFPNQKIDKGLWDHIVSHSDNGRIYGMSWWLDIVHPGWSGLMADDQQSVLPLCAKGWFSKKIVQPIFTQQLGLFSLSANSHFPNELMSQIKGKFSHGYMQCNASNDLSQVNIASIKERMNLVVTPFGEGNSVQHFSTNHRRSYEKGLTANLACREISIEEFMPSFRQYNPVYQSDIKPHEKNLGLLMQAMKNNKAIMSIGVYADKELVAGVVFGHHLGKYTYLFPFTAPEGRANGAMHFLIHAVLNGQMGEVKCLDFEGSEIEGVARFYKGFGANAEPYPVLSW